MQIGAMADVSEEGVGIKTISNIILQATLVTHVTGFNNEGQWWALAESTEGALFQLISLISD